MTVVSNGGLYNSGTYIPWVCNITAITNANPMVVTTAINHGFVVGNQVQFMIPKQWGIQQLNNQTGYISDFTSNTITVLLDSSLFDTFITPVVSLPVVIDQPQVIPIGDSNTGYLTIAGISPMLQIPGTYRNTYP